MLSQKTFTKPIDGGFSQSQVTFLRLRRSESYTALQHATFLLSPFLSLVRHKIACYSVQALKVEKSVNLLLYLISLT